MPKPNYKFAKRQKELAKQKKKREKMQKKLEKKIEVEQNMESGNEELVSDEGETEDSNQD